MNAVLLRRILSGIIVLLVIGTGVSYYFLADMLKKSVIEADHARIDASIYTSDINRLKKLQTQLVKDKDIVTRAHDIVASSTDFKYQDSVINDINSLADQTGVDVTGYTFVDSTAGATTPATPTPSVTAKKVTINIAMRSPVPYDNYLRFLRAIELNLTRFQVTGVNVSPDTVNIRDVINPSIGIEVFVRE